MSDLEELADNGTVMLLVETLGLRRFVWLEFVRCFRRFMFGGCKVGILGAVEFVICSRAMLDLLTRLGGL